MRPHPVIAAALALAACASPRDGGPAAELEPCPTWQNEVGGELQARCGECHGGAAPAGDYSLASYLDALGPGSDSQANAVAGQSASAIVSYLDPAGADPTHAGFGDVHALVRDWVVDCRLAYARSRVHQPGLMNPADSDFHGRLLRALGYDFGACADCHGDDFAGGAARASCLSCHPEGPSDCSTCHSRVAESGSHRAHQAAGVACATCHVVPGEYRDPGHILSSGAIDPAPAEVVFSGLAARNRAAGYDPAGRTCSAVYCHNPARDDNAARPAPVWGGGAGQAACGACHGLPPSSHADDRCPVCHSRVIDRDGGLAATLHIDGAVQVGRGQGGCGDCHGRAGNPAPPPALDGAISSAEVTVGAHLGHVEGALGLRGPIPCSDCHLMPGALESPGHIDSPAPAEVFPGGAGFAGLAAAGGAQPVWDRATATCGDVYCHGGGTTRLGQDSAPGLVRTPQWTLVGVGQAACGTCHGVPPVDGLHAGDLALTDCVICHSRTVDASGTILLTEDAGALTSAHIDGEIDAP